MKLSPEQAAQEVGCSRMTVLRWIARGWLPATQAMNKRWLINPADLGKLKEAYSK